MLERSTDTSQFTSVPVAVVDVSLHRCSDHLGIWWSLDYSSRHSPSLLVVRDDGAWGDQCLGRNEASSTYPRTLEDHGPGSDQGIGFHRATLEVNSMTDHAPV